MIHYYERIIFHNLRKRHSKNGPKENERSKSRPGNTGNKIKTYSPLSYLTAAGRTERYQQAILRFFLVQKLTELQEHRQIMFYFMELNHCRNERFARLLSKRNVRPVTGTKNCNDADISR